MPTLHRSAASARLLPLLLLAAGAAAQDLLVSARRIVVAPDTVLENGEFLVRQGKIAYVGAEIPAEARAKAKALAFADGVVVPGFVLAHSWLGQENDLAERAAPFTPDLKASEAFDPFHDEVAALLPAGITAAALSPSSRNPAAGIAALVQPGKDGGSVLADDLYLKLSLAAVARDQERPPTSLLGCVELLRSQFTLARTTARGGPELTVLRQAATGARRVVVHAETFAELSAALDLARDCGFEPILLGAADAEKVLPRLRESKARVILGALSPEMRLQQLRLPGVLERAGVPVALVAGRAALLRLSAALAVRHGMTRRGALAALTRTPAEMLDQQARVGALRTGCQADFAVWSGDPLDLDSALRGVWVGGQRLAGDATAPAAARTTPAATAQGER